MLPNAAFERRTDDFSYKLNCHPAFASFSHFAKCYGGSACAYFGNDSIKILVPLWNANKTSNLSNAIALPANNGNARRYSGGQMNADRCAGYCANVTKKGWCTLHVMPEPAEA